MDPKPENVWVELTNAFGQFGCYVSITANSVLLLLVHFKSSPLMGSYKTLLICNALFSFFFSFVEMQSKPLIHMKNETIFLIFQKWENKPPSITHVIPVVYSWCYSMSYALLAIQFIYRYIAVCKSDWLDYIEGRRVLIWILAALLICATWSSATLSLFVKSTSSDISFNDLVENFYSLNPETTDYIPYNYFLYENGEKQFDSIKLFGVAQHLTITFVVINVLVFCGVSIYRTAKKQNATSSVATRDLQSQLFRALVFQTLCPVLFNFIPLTVLFTCPILDVDLGAYTNYQVILTQLYPWIDPLVMLFIIEDYRRTLLLIVLFKCETKIAVYDYDQSQYTDFMAMEHDARRVTVF